MKEKGLSSSGTQFRLLRRSFSLLFALLLPVAAFADMVVKGACYDYTRYEGTDYARQIAVLDALGSFTSHAGERTEETAENGDTSITHTYSQLNIRIIKTVTITHDFKLGDSELKVIRGKKLLFHIADGEPVFLSKWHDLNILLKHLGFRVNGFRTNENIFIVDLVRSTDAKK